MVKIVVMRHGQAEPISVNDESRHLTAHGVSEAEQMGQWFNTKLGEVDLLIVSPYIRAQQTAEAVKSKAKSIKEIVVSDDFIPSGDPDIAHDFLDALIALKQPKTVLIISHMPMVSYLTATLTYDEKSPIFVTAGCACIEYDAERTSGKYIGMDGPYSVKPISS